MSMLELISQAASAKPDQSSFDSQYPIVLNPDPILLNLNQPNSNNPSFLQPVTGWQISQTDTDIIELAHKFYNKLKIKSKNPNSFTKNEFLTIFNSYLEKNVDKLGLSIPDEAKEAKEGGAGYSKVLVQKVGFLMGENVVGLVVECCLKFEIWEVLECLIVCGVVNGSWTCCKSLVFSLIEKRKADLVCLFVKYVTDMDVVNVVSVLKFFLSPDKEAYRNMVVVRKEWEREMVLAIEMATDKGVSEKKLSLVKDAAVLLVMGYDEFTPSEICLHYLIGSTNIDDVIFSACVGKLNGLEIMGFVRYLKKWLGKYQKFPQACLSTKGFSTLGLKALESVPSLENVIKCFGLVIDEHFTSLVMLPEFLEEVKSIQSVVNSLAIEARLSCTLANLTASLKN